MPETRPSRPAPDAQTTPVELERVETPAYKEILWSNGRRVRFRSFRKLNEPAGDETKRARQRLNRARRIARRAVGERRKALLKQHGLDPRSLRFSWWP